MPDASRPVRSGAGRVLPAAGPTRAAHAVLGTDDGRYLYAGEEGFVPGEVGATDPGCTCTVILCQVRVHLQACEFRGGVCHDCCTDYSCGC